jgi:broad-specificity NMP kinase
LIGKGLIILLHGAPGVGKTSTAGKFPDILDWMTLTTVHAEGVAELFRKPLFQITCGL